MNNYSQEDHLYLKKNKYAKKWCALDMLSELDPSSFMLTMEQKKELEPMFWHSICTEYDARHFYRQLNNANFLPSQALEVFLGRWLEDEINHANGFKRIYSLIYGVSEKKIDEKLAERQVDFTALEEFFVNEKSLCLLLAYDELVTTHVYNHSIPFYENLGKPILSHWIRQLKYDEAQHFTSIIKVSSHHDMSDAENIIMRIIDVDAAMTDYHGTFVLDHACPEFPFSREEIVDLCQRVILRKLN